MLLGLTLSGVAEGATLYVNGNVLTQPISIMILDPNGYPVAGKTKNDVTFTLACAGQSVTTLTTADVTLTQRTPPANAGDIFYDLTYTGALPSGCIPPTRAFLGGGASGLIVIGLQGSNEFEMRGVVVGAVVSSADCTNSSTVFDTNLTATYTRTDGLKFSGITFTSGILAKETREVLAYNVNGCVTMRPFSGTPSANDTFMVINQ